MFWSKEECIATLKRAILAVEPSYFCVELPDGDHQIGERIFAYELYHQMRVHFPSEHGTIHGEYRKGLRHVPQLGSSDTVIPDLVLHQSGSVDENLLVVEIKTTVRLDVKYLLDDLRKLEYYTRPAGLNFRIGVMLIANTSFPELMRQAGSKAREVAELLNQGPRVAVWNIELPHLNSRSVYELDPSCLKIFRAHDIASLAAER